MNTINQIKLFTVIFFITHFTTNHCMLTEFTHKPLSQQPERLITIHRDRIEKWLQFSERGTLNPIKDITVVRQATEKEQQGTCFNYAIAQARNTVPLVMFKKDGIQNSSIHIEKYFKQTDTPQANDLAIYTDNEKNYNINHFAIIIDKDKNIFESKFGSSTKIIQHQPFAVPISYGDAISYWTLKPKYKENKRKLRKTIRDDTDLFNNGEQRPYKKQKYNDYLL